VATNSSHRYRYTPLRGCTDSLYCILEESTI
jgi:hypothetical protein